MTSNAITVDYLALFEATPTPFLIIVPPDYRIVAVNDAYLRATLTDRQAIVGRTLFDVFPDDPLDPAPTGTANLRASLERVCNNRRADAMAVQRYPIRQKSGEFEVRWWSPINTPVLTTAGEVSLIIHRVEDVTEIMRMRDERDAQDQLTRDQQTIIEQLRQVQMELRRSEERFRVLADASPLLIWVNNPKGDVEFVNLAYREYFGVTDEDLKANGWQPLLHPDDAVAYIVELRSALAEHRGFRARTRMRRRDGAWRWLDSYGAPRFDSAGEFLGLVGSSPDITDIVDAEQTSKDMDRRKDEFLALLAHELRNPLAPIRNGLEILSTTGLTNPVQRQAHQMMQRQLKHLMRLVDDLLDMSRINRGKLEILKERVALSQILDTAVETMQPTLAQSQHRMEMHVAAESIDVDADPIRLTQVFANLISNSARYTQPGGHIRLNASIDGTEAKVEVVDNGAGLPADSVAKIFDLFSQVNTTLNRSSAGGLGLGLSLVRGIVEMHGGRVRADSPGLGQGSTFTVWLPLSNNTATNIATAAEAQHVSVMRRRVLVVDDNRDAAASLTMLLQLLGHDVKQAFSGKEAIDATQYFEPEFVFMDIGMPTMNGVEAARRIRQLKLTKQPLIVALTGFGQDSDRRMTEAAGINVHLTKPADINRIQLLMSGDEYIRH